MTCVVELQTDSRRERDGRKVFSSRQMLLQERKHSALRCPKDHASALRIRQRHSGGLGPEGAVRASEARRLCCQKHAIKSSGINESDCGDKSAGMFAKQTLRINHHTLERK